jgi:methionyl-tRNA synthetase
MKLITDFNAEAFRYYFLRECPYPSDGEYSLARFAAVYDSDLANNLGNLYSRLVTLIGKNFGGELPRIDRPALTLEDVGLEEVVGTVREDVEACRYSLALEKIWRKVLDPANRRIESTAPWKLVKTDRAAAAEVLYDLLEPLRAAVILLKPFMPRSAEVIYQSFNFPVGWDQVRYEHARQPAVYAENVRVLAKLEDGKVRPLFPRLS